ncbi:hypothetical protein CQW23_24259 [Capsicum baccatum]|uniref:Trichome birefringence-like C-terminal domain-containing protein n=1 Tax=Capsicum baccatum TaxID=33114 RepID=A0A2G2VU89_CAPBA|nr:hypothetical protein CQW23_24259 [Capsicum baccatum]
MESEFIAIDKAGEKIEWLWNFLEDIPYWPKPLAPVCIHNDSQATIVRVGSMMYNGKPRHIRRRYKIVKELLSSGIITVDYMKSKDNVSDPLTKALSREGVERTSKGIGLRPRTSQQGGLEQGRERVVLSLLFCQSSGELWQRKELENQPSFDVFWFDPEIALKKLLGKRLMFIGDSLQRNQWQSFVCLVESIIPQDQKSMERHRVHSIFKAKEYYATIEFYWAPFLVESNTDIHNKFDPNQKIVKVDSITQRAQNWLGVDILVFNTYIWWMNGLKINTLWGEFEKGEEGYEELDIPVSYRLALKTWAN